MNMTELQAGPELDALVAEKVLGWRRHEGQCWGFGIPESCRKLKSFSTDIAAAWDIVELFQRRGTINLHFFQGAGTDVAWRVKIRPDILRDGDPGVEEAASTVSLAICRAALLAVEAR